MRTTNGLNKSDKSSSTTSTVVSTTKSPLSPKIPTKPSTLIVNNSTNKPPVPYKPPGLSQKSLINNNNDNNTSSAAPIQSTGSGGSVPNVPDHRTAANNNDWSKRPLPPPPRPPKPMVRTRDVSISTGDDLNHIPPTSLPMANRTPQLCDRQTQLDARNNSLYEDMNGNNIDDSDDTEDMDLNNKTPTNPLTPTTPTNRPIGGGVRGGGGGSGGDDEDVEELFPYGCVNNDLERYRSDGLADSQSTLSSLTTTTASTQWFDAELGPDGQQRQVEGGSRFYRDWDQETINDDISSIASNYQSFASEYRTNSEDREATPVADADDTTDFRLMPAVVDDELPVPSQALKSATNDEMIGMTATGASGVQKSAPMRSQSTRVMSTSVSCKTVQPSRHSLPVNIDDNNDDEPIIEDLDERILFGSVGAGGIGMTPDLHRELRQAIDKRQSNLSSADSTGISSSDVSLHETLMTNNTTIGANNNNNNNNSNGCNSSSNNSDNTSSLSINSDSNSDLSTGKHRHPIQVPNTATTATDTVGCRIAIDRSESVESLANNNNLSSDGEGDDYSLSSANKQTPEYRKRKQNQKLYFIAKELYSSELVFIDVLQLLNNDFRRAVTDHIPDDVLQQILNYLPQLLKINEQLASELKVRIDNWADHQRISDVLVRICPFLKQYSQYIGDFGQITAIYDDALHRYPAFQSAVKEFELTARCQKLSVKHYMLKPVQRIPQYRLLLQDYLNHLSDESDDYADTCCALKIVSQVAEHANNSMKCNENLQKMLSIQQSIITGKCEVIKPGRVFIKEGELMKLSRKGMQERYFILFNDSLLYLTCVQHGVYRVNHELSLTGMRVSLPKQQDFQNEFSIISHTRSFSLAARSPKEREDWVNELNKAIKENTNKRISFAKSRSLIGDSPDIPVLALGASAPVWIPDARVTMCQLCTEEFTVTYRRHHCRCCGNVVCSACSTNKAPMPYLKNRTERVCDECFDGLRLQMERLEIERKHRSDASGASLDSQSATVRTPSTTASASDTDDTTATGADGSAWSLKEWQQIFSRTAERKSHRKAKHRYVPSVLKEVRANDVGSLISGYLHRRESRKQWKNYWYVIKDMVLYTYKASEDVAALKSEPLLGFKVEPLRDSVDGINAKQLVQLSHPGQPTIIFRAETVGQAERWLKAMQTATTLD
ncbi:rhoGEF domain-containing protein gxcJ-like [Oppia nitens]|uniref:rhoGEF domain-containing protein gxcJ-like n=1 Tax=Oppia nitens TaxID=1686743 RepID=UPI0023DC1C01|nr:rhoGEF domain-containing protein gxcJ-like [Oppia nitens]